MEVAGSAEAETGEFRRRETPELVGGSDAAAAENRGEFKEIRWHTWSPTAKSK